MKNTDIAFTLTTSYQTGAVLISGDTDHSINANPNVIKNVTITNQTDQIVSIKASGKSSISGTGRTLAVGASFNYLEIQLDRTFFKAASSPTGNLILTGYIDG